MVANTLASHHGRNDSDSTYITVEIHGGSKRKDRPDGGFYVREMPTSKPLDTSGLNPNSAQGGVLAMAFDWQSGRGSRVSNEHTAPLIVSQTPAVFEGAGVRRLTPTECELLQGFPRRWTDVDGISDTARYKMLGNAVAVPKAKWIGRRIVTCYEETMKRDGG